jgi:3-oxoacyl-[acyl-carrier protein] reductase
MIDAKLTDRIVLVTGANNPAGIGAATAKAFATQGAKVFVHYFRHPLEDRFKKDVESGKGTEPGEALYSSYQTVSGEEVAREIRGEGGVAESWECDLADPGNLTQLFDRVEEALGPVEVLVNNAADWLSDSFIPLVKDVTTWHVDVLANVPQPISAESHDRIFAVNSRAVALLTAEPARRHVTRGADWGRIVNVSSDGASGAPSEVSYWASKYALESFSRSAAMELGRYGITVNIVSPGPVQSGYIAPELGKQLLPTIPLGRLGVAEDLADVIVFLASHQARWLTGQLIYVGGGHKMI